MPLVSQLVAAGAAVDILGPEKRTALHMAVKESRLEVADYLLKKGADPNAACADGQTVLHIAAKVYAKSRFSDGNAAKTLQRVLKAGPNPLRYDKHSRLPADLLHDDDDDALTKLVKEKTEIARERTVSAMERTSVLVNELPTATPREVLWKLMVALHRRDEKALLGCMDSTATQQLTGRCLYRVRIAVLNLRKAMLAAYGRDGWRKLDVPEDFPILDRDIIDNTPVTVTGNKAVFPLEAFGAVIQLTARKKGDRWYIYGEFNPKAAAMGFGPRMIMRGMLNAARMFARLRLQVGKPGATPETLKKALLSAAMAHAFGR